MLIFQFKKNINLGKKFLTNRVRAAHYLCWAENRFAVSAPALSYMDSPKCQAQAAFDIQK
jgi:hypothetical protein